MSRIRSIPVSGTVASPYRVGSTATGGVRPNGPARGRRAAPRHLARPGYLLLEVQVTFVLLGIGLAGLCPLVVMQLRQVRLLEMRLQGQVTETSMITGVSQTRMNNGVILTTPTYYIVRWQNSWAQKLAGSAQILLSTTDELSAIPCDPGALPTHGTSPSNTVNVVALDALPYNQTVTAYVDVTTP